MTHPEDRKLYLIQRRRRQHRNGRSDVEVNYAAAQWLRTHRTPTPLEPRSGMSCALVAIEQGWDYSTGEPSSW